jgi:hypothetical protein
VVAEVVLRDAAQVVDGHRGAVLVVLQAGDLARDVGDVLEAELLESGAVECRDRGADILQVLLASLRGNNDLAELVAGFLGGFLCPGAG